MSQLMKCRLKHAGCMGTIYMVGGAAHRLAAAMQGMPAQWKPIWPWAYICVARRSVTTALGWLRTLAIIVCICPLLACCRDRASASGMLGECKALVFHLGDTKVLNPPVLGVLMLTAQGYLLHHPKWFVLC